jgi:hypothetical protein
VVLVVVVVVRPTALVHLRLELLTQVVVVVVVLE